MTTSAEAGLELLKKAIPAETLRKMAELEAWYRGDLRHLLQKGAQTRAYNMIVRHQEENPGHPGPCMLHMHRGSGKSWLLVILAIERCLRYPNQQIRLGAPLLGQIEDITEPALRQILGKCPEELRPEKKKGVYHFKNPRWNDDSAVSRLILFGAREGADAQRGKRSNMVLFDEVRDLGLDMAEYVLDSVLGPHIVKQDHPLFIYSSTSPNVLGHYWWTMVDRAQPEGRYIHVTVEDNEDFSPQDEQALLAICGGSRDSVAWKREALCERVSDESALAVPSFTRKRPAIVREIDRPDRFYPYIFADIGYRDAAAFLYCYIHYPSQLLVIEDELVRTTVGTWQLIEEAREKEVQWYAETPLYNQILRWADATPRELDDFRSAGLFFSHARKGQEKWDKWAGLARLEAHFHEEKIVIHPRCKHLIHQCENSVRNRYRTDLEKVAPSSDPNSPIMGHQDALWALAYGVWQVRNRWLVSPYADAPVMSDQIDVSAMERKLAPQPTKIRRDSSGITSNPITVTRRPI